MTNKSTISIVTDRGRWELNLDTLPDDVSSLLTELETNVCFIHFLIPFSYSFFLIPFSILFFQLFLFLFLLSFTIISFD